MSAQSITVRVFVSSTWLDLRPERKAVEAALQRLRETKFVGMEYFGSRDESTRHASLNEVDRSQVYVGIFGGRYGSGITEAEYRRARERGLPCFIYFKDEASIPAERHETDPEKAGRLAELKEELRRLHTVITFITPDDLAARMTADLHRWLFDEYLVPTLERVSLLGDEANIRRLTEAVRDKEALRTVLAQRGIAVGGDVVQSLLVTGSHNVINFLVQGITALPTDYASRVQNFLIEYLGTPDRPVPFGGRKADLAHLGNWLDDPQTSPYLLLAASAGRGKSALLARWSRRLLARRDLAVVFIPVSVRFRTNLAGVVFAALAARLAQLHGEQVPSGVDTPAEVWRGMVTNYLARPLPEGRRLLLILDGVDEAADWEVGPDLFPLAPPPGLRIVVSARYLAGDTSAIDWLRRLGWEHRGLAQASDLDPLTREGVADVLRRMRFPLDQLGARVDIVAELHRLSEGDPLLVRLYVDDLWERGEAAARLHPENLRVIRPGLKGYFERWWEDQHRLWGDSAPLRERAVQIVLNLLTCALGPLSQEDVLRLAPPESELNTWTLEQALRPLARFVIGDGHQQGYVFSHPRLGAYFYEKLTDGERHTWEARFLTWGEKTLAALEAGQQEPEEAPPYLVQYYGAHLERARVMPERLLALVSDGWQRAWEVLEGSYAGFLNDVERAWRAAERANMMAAQAGKLAPHLGSEVRCALCLASVRSLAQNVPPTLLVALVEQSVWTPTQGLAYAQQVPEPMQRAWALTVLAPLLSEPLKIDALCEALATAGAIEDEDERAWALVELAPHLPKPLLREALDTVQAIRDKFERVVVLAELMPHLPEPLKSDALREALDTVQAIRDEFEQVVVPAGLMPHLPEPLKSNVLREALDTARAIEDEDERAEALAELAPYLPRPLLREALEVARAIVSEYERAEALAALVPLLPEPLKSDVLREALNAAWATRNVNNRTAALAVLIPFLPEPLKSDAMREALNTAWMNVSEHMLAKALAKLAPLLPEPLKSDELREALEAVRTIEDEDRRTKALAALIPHLPEPLKSDAVREAMNVVRTIEGRYQQLEALAELAPCLPKPLLHKALDVVRLIEDKRYWSRALAGLAFRLAGLGYPEEAVNTARAIEDEDRRVEALTALVPHLPEPLKSDVLRKVLDAARMIEDKGFWWMARSGRLRAQALVALAPHLPEPLLREVLNTVQVIRSEHLRAEALVALAPHLPEPLLRKALNAARAIENEDERAWALARLAPRLAELGFPEEALAMARAIREANERTRALAELAPQLLEPLKSDALREALDAAQTIRGEYMRVEALVALVPQLPEPLKSDALREAINAARLVGEPTRVEVLIALAPYLSEPLKSDALREALDTVRAIEDGYWRREALARLAPRLAELGHPEEALTMARAIKDKDRRAEVLVALAPYLPEPLKSDALREALDTAWMITYGYRRAKALAALFPHLPEPLLRKALDTARATEWDLDRVWTLAELSPHLPEAERLAMLCEALEAARAIEDEDERAWALARLAPHLAQLSPTTLYPLWCESLHRLATRTRSDLLVDLVELYPVIIALSGTEAVTETARAIQDVGRWWP